MSDRDFLMQGEIDPSMLGRVRLEASAARSRRVLR